MFWERRDQVLSDKYWARRELAGLAGLVSLHGPREVPACRAGRARAWFDARGLSFEFESDTAERAVQLDPGDAPPVRVAQSRVRG